MFDAFNAIFDQPDITADLDNQEFEVTTYQATATRTESTWTVTAHDLPGDQVVHAEGETWPEAEARIQESVSAHLGVDRTTVVVSVKPAEPEARAALYALTGARITRAKAEQAERDAARHAAGLLIDQGWAAEDVGAALRLPTDRIAQFRTEPPAGHSSTPRTP